ncbi:MAG: pyridoxal-dependent decarboxylase [Verrucomicrobiota bacterium]
MDRVRDFFFSRNPDYWPAFRDPGFEEFMAFRRRRVPLKERVENYADGESFFDRLKEESTVPPSMMSPEGAPDRMLTFVAALSKNWEDPRSVENVATMPSDPAIYGSMIGAMANANLVHPEYSEMANDLEASVVRQIANLVGYNPDKATGIFTQGGTFCNLYGYLLGIRKSLPNARTLGMEYIQDYRIINSQGGHYSNTTNLSLLGVNIRKKTIRIQVSRTNDMDLDDLETQLLSCFRLKCVVPTIMLTMGTTDTFGVDRVKPVYDLVNRLCQQFEVKMKPHIHVDAAVGWPLIFFLDYDFSENPLGINPVTLGGLRRHVERFSEMKYADSFTIDFQKWGFVPYTSSLVMIRDKADLRFLENDPENFSYFEQNTEGQTHLHATIECSRGAVGLFGAYSGLRYLGVEGYQTAIAHGLQNANYFRYRLSQVPGVKVLAAANQGPSVAFRMYDQEKVEDPDGEFDFEYRIQGDTGYRNRVNGNSRYHREMFLQRGKVGLFTNWVGSIAHTDYDEKGRYRFIPGEKAVFMNPATTRVEIDRFIDNIRGSR